jgi:hypothetical protein
MGIEATITPRHRDELGTDRPRARPTGNGAMTGRLRRDPVLVGGHATAGDGLQVGLAISVSRAARD